MRIGCRRRGGTAAPAAAPPGARSIDADGRPPDARRPTPRPRRTAAGRAATGGGIEQLPWRRLVNPFRPVEILSADQVEAIHRASLRILAEIGVRGPRRPGARRLRAAPGATVDRLDPHASGSTRPRSRRSSRRRRASSGSTPGTRSATSSSAAPTSSSARSAARPSSPTSTAAGGPATSPTSSTTSGSSARSTSSTRRAAARSSRPTCRSRPATSTCTATFADGARQDLAVPRLRARRRSTTRSRSPASSAASTATTLVREPSADDDHQHELAAPPRRPDGRRADRDGARTASRSSPRRSPWPGR